MILVILQFHYGRKAFVRNDNMEYSEEVNVEQKLHQSYLLSSLLFIVIFAAGLLVNLQCFSEDLDILANFAFFTNSRRGLTRK